MNVLPIQKNLRSKYVSDPFKDKFQLPILKRRIFASLARPNRIQP